jgi:hypothetical protein
MNVEDTTPRGTRVWRAYFKDRPSFCFGLWVGYGAEDARAHALQWGTVSSVELVT